MQQMFSTLYEMGRADILRAIKAGKQSPMVVYEHYRQGRLNELPSGELGQPIEKAYRQWLAEKELAPRTVLDYERVLETLPLQGKLLTDLPEILAQHRRSSRGQNPRTFNQDRSAILSCLGSMLGDDHWLYQRVRRVAPLKITEERKLPTNPQTVAELTALAQKLKPHHARTLWGFALTGMRPEEMFEEGKNRWAVEPELIRVDGTKSTASKRVVPRVGLLTKPQTGRLAFYRALRAASGDTVTPYDLRRSYSQFLDLARIPQFRQDHYMAHGPRSIGEHYKRMKQCLPYLIEDSQALARLVAEPLGLRIVK